MDGWRVAGSVFPRIRANAFFDNMSKMPAAQTTCHTSGVPTSSIPSTQSTLPSKLIISMDKSVEHMECVGKWWNATRDEHCTWLRACKKDRQRDV